MPLRTGIYSRLSPIPDDIYSHIPEVGRILSIVTAGFHLSNCGDAVHRCRMLIYSMRHTCCHGFLSERDRSSKSRMKTNSISMTYSVVIHALYEYYRKHK